MIQRPRRALVRQCAFQIQTDIGTAAEEDEEEACEGGDCAGGDGEVDSEEVGGSDDDSGEEDTEGDFEGHDGEDAD